MCHTHTEDAYAAEVAEIEAAYAAAYEEREQELREWELYYAESEDYDNLPLVAVSHAERMELEAAVDRYLDEREDREQEMLEAQWHEAEQGEVVPTTVTALIRNDAGQLLYVMGTDGEWELPWGPITAHGDHDHEVYSAHEMDSMMSLMVLIRLGVRIASCQWVSRADGDDYEVTLVDYPEVDGETTMWC